MSHASTPTLVRPDGADTSDYAVIHHAIRFTLQNAVILNKFIYPASHIANPGNTNTAIQPPMGSRFRLKASVDTSRFPMRCSASSTMVRFARS